MKRSYLLLFILLTHLGLYAQEKKQDTVKTEVVTIVTKYNPKIADAKKILVNPTIKLLKQNERKKLDYTIFSAPVASTFVPKSGAIKGINVGVKERIYKNYIAAGYGNFASPYFEAFLHHSTRFQNEFGIYTKYSASEENIQNTALNSNFSNFNIGAFYQQEERYFDWKASIYSEKNTYNWFGLPNLVFTEPTINTINEEQSYTFYKLMGDVKFEDSYIDYGKLNVSYFTDQYESTEILAKFDAKLDFPLAFISRNLNDISVKTSIEYLNGKFRQSYSDFNPINYNTLTLYLHPEYNLNFKNILLKVGLQLYASIDAQNEVTNNILIPDVSIQTPVFKDYIRFYGGYTGGLHTNTYKNFTEQNPYVSPTLFITQTLEKFNIFVGISGKITNNLSYNIKASSISEEDKPLFIRNASKSDGTNTVVNGFTILGYEYGNSFTVFYDDVKTNVLYTELEYDFSKNLVFKIQGIYNQFTLNNAIEPWNLPTSEASFTTTYKQKKWFATSNIFYLSERKDTLFNGLFPSSFSGVETINSFVDVNLNGGYHFNDKFSAFLKLNNILNTNYQRFANFDVQGFQVLGGITYKFDF